MVEDAIAVTRFSTNSSNTHGPPASTPSQHQDPEEGHQGMSGLSRPESPMRRFTARKAVHELLLGRRVLRRDRPSLQTVSELP